MDDAHNTLAHEPTETAQPNGPAITSGEAEKVPEVRDGGATEDPELNRVDAMCAEHNADVVRLPPYHCCYNPIELNWSQLKHTLCSEGTTHGNLEMGLAATRNAGNIDVVLVVTSFSFSRCTSVCCGLLVLVLWFWSSSRGLLVRKKGVL
ncbi:unnamed protein product [Caenorhabditis auriculariae]|uniref:Tc1-like transposase DDE domain-containing protein n=1 Tax=Caenorhabditis auriculariae TaxID=2777116 RepID=A0A8S1H2Q3_9PELO|nr:unnamed protein product [Caenorhabditis auriculariae]